jgi:hypothetical protein
MARLSRRIQQLEELYASGTAEERTAANRSREDLVSRRVERPGPPTPRLC